MRIVELLPFANDHIFHFIKHLGQVDFSGGNDFAVALMLVMRIRGQVFCSGIGSIVIAKKQLRFRAIIVAVF